MKNLSHVLSPVTVAGLVLFTFFLSGCLSLNKYTGYFRQEPCYAHTVRWPGENLSLISKWYTGSAENWRILARANPNLVPDKIQVGETIRVPEKIMQTKKPLPRDFVMLRSETHEGPVSSKAPQGAPPLFGPKPHPSR